ncbi:MAG: hypothetical protein FJW79_12060 [Actinobacteria bacterium]|nr:hypothetical protein [Actinomycetota bacterium]
MAIEVERRGDAPVLVEMKEGFGKGAKRVLASLRLAMGFIFAWAFIDKLVGLGFSTGRQADGTIDFFAEGAAALNGGLPAAGFLGRARGPLGGFWQGMADQAWVSWIFMAALAGVGLALLLGIGMRLAAVSGGLLMLCMWSAGLWPQSNPFVDSHIIYALVVVVLAVTASGHTWGFGERWGRTRLVQRFPILK